MLTNVDKKNAKKRQKFICEACDFVCFKKSDFIRHEATRKHKMLTNVDKMLTEKCQKTPDEFQCECGKVFKHRQSLSVHRKKCQIIPAEVCPPVAVQSTPNRCENQKDQIIEIQGRLIDQYKDALKSKDTCIETQDKAITAMKTVIESGNLGGNNTNHSHNTTNSHNKTFNLNFYLNETCKDAMNLQDFIKTLQLNLADLERVGELGYTEGISRMFIKGLNDLDETRRPIHCSDLKREVIHIKDNDVWEQDNENRDKLRKAINDISNKNIMLLDDWRQENPGFDQYDSKKNDLYLKLLVNTMGPDSPDATDKAFRKIIRKVASNTIIKKNAGMV
jgi:hypothetical protein